MRIGVISDTHDNLRNVARMVEVLNGARVDRVVHAGDITQAKTLELLAGLEAPLCGVYGNNDLERDSLEAAADALGFTFVDPPLRLEWAGRRIVVVHDVTEHERPELYAGDVLLHGHDHFLRIETVGETLAFNPGECAGHVHGQNAVGLLDLVRLEAGVVLF